MPGTGVGEQTVFMLGPNESSYGAGGTCDRGYEVLPGETLHKEVLTRPVPGLRGGTRNGQVIAKDRRTGEQASGSVPMLVPTLGAGRIFQHTTGGTPVITGGGAAKTHVYPTGVLLGKSFPAQKQIYDGAGVFIAAFTYDGGKLITNRFSMDQDGYLQAALACDFRRERDDVAAATASYTELVPFTYEEGFLSINGVDVTTLTLSSWIEFGNPANVNKRRMGGNGFKKEPTDSARPTVTGEAVVDFADLSLYDLYSAQTTVALRMKFTSDVVIPTTATPFSVQFDVPALHLKGNTAQVANEGDVTVTIPWTAGVDVGGDPLASITYVTSDAAP